MLPELRDYGESTGTSAHKRAVLEEVLCVQSCFSLLLSSSLAVVSAATLTGKIIGPDGKPITGAFVHVEHKYPVPQVWELRSGDAGEFAADVAVPPAMLRIRQFWSIVAYLPGYALSSANSWKSGDVITLAREATLGGTVMDTEGKPLAGIPIRLLFAGTFSNGESTNILVPETWSARFTTVSDANGAWKLTGVPADGDTTIAIDGERYVHDSKTVTLTAGQPANVVSFTARPGATVAGRVFSALGTPVVGARVDVMQSQRHTAIRAYGTAITAADGSYRVGGLLTDNYDIRVTDNAYFAGKDWIAEPLTGIALTEGKVTAAPDLRTHPGAKVAGVLVDADTGKPIAEYARLLLLQRDNEDNAPAASLATDKLGHFSGHVPVGQMVLCVSVPPYGYILPQRTEVTPLDLTEGKSISLSIKLHKGLSITGKVVGEHGEPAAGERFFISREDKQGGQTDSCAAFTTEDDGTFAAAGLPRGELLSVISAAGASRPCSRDSTCRPGRRFASR